MAQEWAKAFYASKQWQECRRYVLSLHHGLCAGCESKGLIRSADVVHHKIVLTANNIKNPDISLNPEHLVPLCQDCHAEAHRSEQPKRRYIVNKDGNISIAPWSASD